MEKFSGTKVVLKLDLPPNSILIDSMVNDNYWLQIYRSPDKEFIPILIDLTTMTYKRVEMNEH